MKHAVLTKTRKKAALTTKAYMTILAGVGFGMQ